LRTTKRTRRVSRRRKCGEGFLAEDAWEWGRGARRNKCGRKKPPLYMSNQEGLRTLQSMQNRRAGRGEEKMDQRKKAAGLSGEGADLIGKFPAPRPPSCQLALRGQCLVRGKGFPAPQKKTTRIERRRGKREFAPKGKKISPSNDFHATRGQRKKKEADCSLTKGKKTECCER